MMQPIKFRHYSHSPGKETLQQPVQQGCPRPPTSRADPETLVQLVRTGIYNLYQPHQASTFIDFSAQLSLSLVCIFY
jgi:hypothetical protein